MSPSKSDMSPPEDSVPGPGASNGEGETGGTPTDGRSIRAAEQRKARRRQVLDRALKVFSEKGYHDASITDIIEAAGIARGTFYLYFENKRAIFEELLDSFIARIVGAVQRVRVDDDAPEPVEQVLKNVARIVDVLLDNRDFTRLLLRQAVGLDTEFDQRLAGFYGTMIGFIEGGIILGQEMGIVRPCEPRVTASCILGSVKEVANQYLLQTGGDFPDKEVLVQEILKYNLQGVFRWDNR